MRDLKVGSPGRVTDRRIRRSRAALIAAVTDLAFERGYEDLGPAEVAQRADVGRSTFYAHFAGVDDLLAQSLERHLTVLASSAVEPGLGAPLLAVAEHFWTQRKIARRILQGPARRAIADLLVRRLEDALTALCREHRVIRPDVPVSLAATQIAAGQLATLEAWLSGRVTASPAQVTALLHGCARAATAILIDMPPHSLQQRRLDRGAPRG